MIINPDTQLEGGRNEERNREREKAREGSRQWEKIEKKWIGKNKEL